MMVAEKQTSKLVPILWFTAGALALAAAAIRYFSDGELKWTLLAPAVFLIAMGWSFWKRTRSEPR